MNKFKIYPALITPFTEDNLIDFEALRLLVLRLIKEQCDGFVVLGTTAEACSLSIDERVMILRFLRVLIPKSVAMIVGVGTNNIEDTLRNIQIASELGADSVLIVTPYYVCPSQEGLYAYYDMISENCPLPIYLYNVKRRCGVELEGKTIERLVNKHSNIIGLKQACGKYESYLYLKKLYPGFEIFSGDDGNLFEAMKLGLDGTISVAANAKLSLMRQLMDDVKSENDKEMWQKLCECLFKEPTPAPVKYMVMRQGIGKATVRLPLCGVSDTLRFELDQYI